MRPIMVLLIAVGLVPAASFHVAAKGPIVVVTASWPDAYAAVVAEQIARPIEAQINGIEGMTRIASESRNDGTYIAQLCFDPKTDPKEVVVRVGNRVALALPLLPNEVKQSGVAVKLGDAAEGVTKNVTIALSDRGDNGREALRGFSEAVLKRIVAEGVIAKTGLFPGSDEKQVYVQIDRARCAELGIAIPDVAKAIKSVGAKRTVKKLETAFVTTSQGAQVPLVKIASFKEVTGPTGVYRLDFRPAIRLSGTPPVGKTVASVAQRCAELAEAERKKQKHADDFAVVNLTER